MRRAIHILRIGGAAVLFVIVLELCARLDDYISFRAPILGSYSDDNLYENDQLGKHGKPFARYRKWQLNEFGYRGPRFEQDRLHIVIFGASETFGLYESDDSEYPRQFERELNAHACKPIFQVINVAYPGQTLPTATRRVPEIAARIHPQIALIYASPTFYIDLPLRRSEQPAQVERSSDFQFRIGERLQNILKLLLPESIQTAIRTWQIRRSIGAKVALERLPEQAINRFREDLTDIVTVLRANGIEPVVVTHATIFGPMPRNPDRAMLVAWRKFYPMLKEDGFLDLEQRTNQAVRDVAVQQHVTLVDIAREIPGDRKYFADFVHFTDAGAALMAKSLAAGIEPLLQRSSPCSHVSAASTNPSSNHGKSVIP
jgi:lysophospholipase L1-like esterase